MKLLVLGGTRFLVRAVVDDAFLLEHEVGQWMELPLWIADPEEVGVHLADERARRSWSAAPAPTGG